ncbi:UDP-glucose dehydrogenase family protein [Bacillus sp. Marseille-P3661]|uniref:UDP-glucose dehydrogenase family protein n=1 Tax=Bacillus sp. Marseille-P3661 TaxID=1936234 RepID=UPI000C815C60|nr:UDP-glucose/GDP-mannose dehydrogenase family protein [Bacillus sp. Marseille-P3661]
MRNLTIIGIGYVGLVTGACLSEIGHHVTCIDVDSTRVDMLKKGHSPFYEPGLEDLLKRNIKKGTLQFTTDYKVGLAHAEVIYITVDTPIKEDGSADLTYVNHVANEIAVHVTKDVIVVIKSTVPVGTNKFIKEFIQTKVKDPTIRIEVISNPEFLREGSAIEDTFKGDRIIIGYENEQAAAVIEDINKRFHIPIMKTNLYSAEMIKYAANSFLAMKISFMNEIANVCEKLGGNVDEIARGIGLDSRIGKQFLQAGVGYGGSCFPKDTAALLQIADQAGYHFEMLETVINVNHKQPVRIVEKAKNRFSTLKDKKIALLGLAFKPNTDDIRNAPSLAISEQFLSEGAQVFAYDPIAMEKAKSILSNKVVLTSNIDETLLGADLAVIVTEWSEFKELPLTIFAELMKTPIIFDGRNCFPLDETSHYNIEYHSTGRPVIGEIDIN